MKQKYSLTHDDRQARLIIREYGEHEKGSYVLLCEAVYDDEAVRGAIGAGGHSLVSLLRSPDFYPPAEHADRIAEGVSALYADGAQPVREIHLDDIETLARQRAAAAERLEHPAADDIGMLLDDELEDGENGPPPPADTDDDIASGPLQGNEKGVAEE